MSVVVIAVDGDVVGWGFALVNSFSVGGHTGSHLGKLGSTLTETAVRSTGSGGSRVGFDVFAQIPTLDGGVDGGALVGKGVPVTAKRPVRGDIGVSWSEGAAV